MIDTHKLKIVDFNISKLCKNKFETSVKNYMKLFSHIGTMEFMAPEAIQGYSGYSEQIDMWSAGLILYFLFTGTTPFNGLKYNFHDF